MLVNDEVKQSKILELENLKGQYEAGERLNIDADKYPIWCKCLSMLKVANINTTIYDDFLKNPSHYMINKDKIILNPEWEAEEKEAEEKRIASLHITKYDLYTNFCAPAGMSYDELVAKIKELNIQAAWELCNHVFYGVIKPFFAQISTGMSEKEIITKFEEIMAKSVS